MDHSADSRRRRRFMRSESDGPLVLDSVDQRVLEALAQVDLASLPQLAEYVGQSAKTTRERMRRLFDGRAVDIIPCTRAALGQDTGPADVLGSAPNVYAITPTGRSAAGLMSGSAARASRLGPQSALFAAHTLAVTDVLIWLTACERHDPSVSLSCWRAGAEAAIPATGHLASVTARPDAWFAAACGPGVLVGLVEVDRSTEPLAGRRWADKLSQYEALFDSAGIKRATGYANARLLAIAPDAARRQRLSAYIEAHASPSLAGRCWLAERAVLDVPRLGIPVWQRPGHVGLHPLVEDPAR